MSWHVNIYRWTQHVYYQTVFFYSFLPIVTRFIVKFQVPRSRLLLHPNLQTLHPASPVIQWTTPPPQAHPRPWAPLPSPQPATHPPRPALPPLSHVPRPDATPVTSPQSKRPAIHPQSLRHRPALRRSQRCSGTSGARTPRLRAPQPLQTPLRPPLPTRMQWLLRPRLPTSRAPFPGRGPSPNPGTDRASRPHPSPPRRPVIPMGSVPLRTRWWVSVVSCFYGMSNILLLLCMHWH